MMDSDMKKRGDGMTSKAFEQLQSQVQNGSKSQSKVTKNRKRQNSCLTTRAFKKGAAESGKKAISSDELGEGGKQDTMPPSSSHRPVFSFA